MVVLFKNCGGGYFVFVFSFAKKIWCILKRLSTILIWRTSVPLIMHLKYIQKQKE